MYFNQPIGCLLSIPITGIMSKIYNNRFPYFSLHYFFFFDFSDPLGRKRSMILVNIPFAIGWFMLYQATTVSEVFIGITFLGLAIGLMEAPIVTYIGITTIIFK